MAVTIIILVVCLLLGFPIYVALLSSGLFLLVLVEGVPPEMVIVGLYDGVAKFTLVAVPLFLLAGALMQNSSMAARLVDSIMPWLARVRGGIPLGSIIANEIFGAISGSAPAAAGTIGRAMFPAVSRSNGEQFALGLFASAGAIAIVMPPSINMILFATATGASTGLLFLAGIVPAIIVGVCLGFYIWMHSPRVEERERLDLRLALRKTAEGIPVLLLPVLILGGIYIGVFTPTEAAVVSVVYSFLLAFVIYREIGLQEIVASIKDTTKLTAQLFILIAASTVFSQALTVAQVPQMVGDLLSGLNPGLFLLLLNLVLLVVGCFFDPSSAILVLAPIVTPIAQSLGIDPLHLGIVFAVNLAIGMFTPPFGLNLFVIQSIFKKPLEQIAKAVPGFFVAFVVALLIITYFPQLYLWLPKMALAQ